ncbi:hypothetical protein [Methanospirillum hungatei]|uniref:hypothetical protein n=1 Tax=Methanospirillum hungatei TaxID=2203 RepID=UPI0026F260DB|nr:hypothetical protein [Methanospirillum hungatei]MCA1916919.1 hypothetical protein [Methanospirillum hungatei]
MKDDAVSPVVAFMLLLMIVVSFISVLNAYYIPSLKQQAEIDHLHNVEQSFLKISSDILQILTFRQNMTMSESIQLGGGDVYFSSVKSSGYLEVNTSVQDNPLYTINIQVENKDDHIIYSQYSEINQSKIIFRPIGNFWINQGYEWEDGIIYITKGNRKTSLIYSDTDEKIQQTRNNYYNMSLPRIKLSESQNNLTNIIIDIINIENPLQKRSYSGNGYGSFIVDLKKVKQYSAPLNISEKIIFDTSNSAVNYGVDSTINDTFYRSIPWTNAIWDHNSFTLTIPNNPILLMENKIPDLTINLWNLSFHF